MLISSPLPVFRDGKSEWLAVLGSLYSWAVLVLAQCENAKKIDSFGVLVLTYSS